LFFSITPIYPIFGASGKPGAVQTFSGNRIGRGTNALRHRRAGHSFGPSYRRVVIKTRIVKFRTGNQKSEIGAARAHLNYIQRDGVAKENESGQLYDATHEIMPVRQDRSETTIFGDLVGPVCETGDYLVRSIDLPAVTQGDLLAVMGAGAYGAVMSSTYNSRPLIAEVLVDGDRFHTIRPRQTIADLIGLDSVPDWLI